MSLALAAMLVSALLVGALIGCVGIGGVLLPPFLVYVGGLDFHLAAATSMWAFLFAGAAGTLTYSKRRNVDPRMVAYLSVGVVPAAILGAWANVALSEGALMALLGVLMVATGAAALLGSPAAERLQPLEAPGLLAIGAVVGFGSALTGTGGPVLLVPIMLFLRLPILGTVGASQAVSLVVATFSIAGYVLFGRVDFVLGTALGMVAVFGVVVGARIAHAAPAMALRRVVASALVGAGLLIAAQTAWGSPAGGNSAKTAPAIPVFASCVEADPITVAPTRTWRA